MHDLLLCAALLFPVIGIGFAAVVYGLLFCRREAIRMLAALLYAILLCGLFVRKKVPSLIHYNRKAGCVPVKHASAK